MHLVINLLLYRLYSCNSSRCVSGNAMLIKNKIKLQAILSAAHQDFEKGLNARAYFKVNDHSLGQDLVQSTFLKTWKYLIKGGKIDLMRAFLYHILNNLIVDEYRKRKATSLDALLETGFEPVHQEQSSLIDMLDGKKAMLLIQQLPLEYQKVMRMRYVQELSLEEMSLITGKSKNTMSVQVYRGLKLLKSLYKY